MLTLAHTHGLSKSKLVLSTCIDSVQGVEVRGEQTGQIPSTTVPHFFAFLSSSPFVILTFFCVLLSITLYTTKVIETESLIREEHFCN